MRIDCVLNGRDDLHSFGVVDFFAAALVVVEESDCSIERARGELPSRRSVVDISDGCDVIFVDSSGLVHFSDIERVAVGVVTSDSEVDWLNGVEAKTHGFVRKSYLLNSSLSSQVIDDDRTIAATSAKNVSIRGVVLHL